MQTTTTLKDILQSELIKHGKNEFINKISGKTQITDNNRNFAFIYKIMEYDDDVKNIVNEEFFNNIIITENINADDYFKKIFCNRFIDRQIAPQTVEAFASRVSALYMTRMVEIKVLYEKLEDYFDGKNTLQTDDKSGFNDVNATLPQDEVNMDLSANTQDYGDQNTINRAFNKQNHVSTNASPDNILKLTHVWEEILDSFDVTCFSQLF